MVVFHEQVIEIIAQLTGCTLAEADEARRALGDVEGMAEARVWFLPRAMARGYSRRVVEAVWKVLEAFGSFGFCKAHAAAFALPTYQSAWLKTHYPAHFLSGVLTHDPGMYPKRLILDDARQFGIAVLGLDVNASEQDLHRGAAGRARRRAASPLRHPAGAGGGQGHLRGRGGPDRRGPALPVAHRLLAPRAGLPPGGRAAGAGRRVRPVYGIGETGAVRRRGTVTRRDLLLQVADLDRYARAVDRAGAGPRPRAVRAGDGRGRRTERLDAAAGRNSSDPRSGESEQRDRGLGRAHRPVAGAAHPGARWPRSS